MFYLITTHRSSLHLIFNYTIDQRRKRAAEGHKNRSAARGAPERRQNENGSPARQRKADRMRPASDCGRISRTGGENPFRILPEHRPTLQYRRRSRLLRRKENLCGRGLPARAVAGRLGDRRRARRRQGSGSLPDGLYQYDLIYSKRPQAFSPAAVMILTETHQYLKY